VTPVVILTSSDSPADIARCYRLGANSYVRKPVDFDEFAGLMHRLGTYWLTINQWPRGSASDSREEIGG
jgi:DNA-binding NarL/FixJ family response regulator